jgi:hypothetical protein
MRRKFLLRFICLLLLVLDGVRAQAPPQPSRADILRGAYSQWRANNDLLS